ncbi:MAG: 50S ribosomal protein L13 [Candidatus Omnitrophica bacterium]|nr:50S ribosomal protein L13 [Candidatus Omnitrophota bacterium]MBU1933373.1 50S ribosomal protein L13 [Candidatus Omnitrophota bacterium]
MITTFVTKKDVDRKYYLLDAEGKILGRLATQVALILSGKRKVSYTSNVDGGDFVVVVNAEKIKVTGLKPKQKVYKKYSGFPSGQKVTTLERMLETKPTEVIRHAVKGMIPKNKLGSRMITRLKVYAGPKHPHQAQNPEKIEVSEG